MIGGIVTAPAVGFMIAPAFLKQGQKDHDIGPLSDYPEGKYLIVTYMADASQGEVSRRTAFVRYNGQLKGQPSFTIISNHCAHLGCPVQANGPLDEKNTKQIGDVTLIPTVSIAGFGCPCHGGQYNTEGNRTAGPPVRALDRYAFSIRNGHLFIGKPFSVSHVDGAGASAVIHKWTFAFPGEHVNGLESWLYPDPAAPLIQEHHGHASTHPERANSADDPVSDRLARGALRASSAGSSTSSSGRSPATRTGSRRSARRR